MTRQHRQPVTHFTSAPAKRPARHTFNALPAVITIVIISAALVALRLTNGA